MLLWSGAVSTTGAGWRRSIMLTAPAVDVPASARGHCRSSECTGAPRETVAARCPEVRTSQTATQPSWLAERTHDGCSVVVASAETADWCSPTSCSCGRVKLTLRTKPSAPPEKSAEAPCDQPTHSAGAACVYVSRWSAVRPSPSTFQTRTLPSHEEAATWWAGPPKMTSLTLSSGGVGSESASGPCPPTAAEGAMAFVVFGGPDARPPNPVGTEMPPPNAPVDAEKVVVPADCAELKPNEPDGTDEKLLNGPPVATPPPAGGQKGEAGPAAAAAEVVGDVVPKADVGVAPNVEATPPPNDVATFEPKAPAGAGEPPRESDAPKPPNEPNELGAELTGPGCELAASPSSNATTAAWPLSRATINAVLPFRVVMSVCARNESNSFTASVWPACAA
mmetsp:Transcript_37144/g.78248  ORF Transcript_37144/g.78248 Transcript_37144/m.78248 type:complete len:394 (-) Transcript_37144:31-1212(-)